MEHVRGTLDEVIAHFEDVEPKGEIVIVLAGKEKTRSEKRNKHNDYGKEGEGLQL